MIIRVTRNDIREGIQVDTTSCAVALALARQLRPRKKFSRGVTVDNDSIRVTDTGEILPISTRLAEFITAFDRDRDSVRPTSFRIRRPTL